NGNNKNNNYNDYVHKYNHNNNENDYYNYNYNEYDAHTNYNDYDHNDYDYYNNNNNKYSANNTTSNQKVLTALQAAGITIIRIFITQIFANTKSTDSIGTLDLEPIAIGSYNDAVLNQIDTLMYRATLLGIRLQITMHDRWVLDSTWGICDVYCATYTTTDPITGVPNISQFYTSSSATAAFDARLAYIVSHRNPLMGSRAWMDIPEGVYSFEIENEAMGMSNGVEQTGDLMWWCIRATQLRKVIGNSQVLIGTGGGQTFETSLIPQNLGCEAIDVVGMHSYDNSESYFNASLYNGMQSAKDYGKRVILQEFGATSAKDQWVAIVASICNSLRIPWMPWEVSTVSLQSDYEFWTDDAATWAALTQYAHQAI
ncbi:hypothetical protein HK100_002214, partial [Physocladia obscura]